MRRLNKYEYLVLTVLITFLIPYFYLSFFTQPIADDFILSNIAMNRDFFEMQKHAYKTMNGRYVANIFMFNNPLTFGSVIGYKIAPLIFIISFVLSSFWMIKNIFYSIKTIQLICASLIFTLLYLVNLPNIAEGLYWFTGASIYFLGTIFTLIYFGFLIKFLTIRLSIKHQIIASLMLIMSIGFNEVTAICILIGLAFITIASHFQKIKQQRFIYFQMLLGLIALLIMVIAPGNINRDHLYQDNHNILYSAGMSGIQIVRFGLQWVFSIPILLLSILIIIYNKKIKSVLALYNFLSKLNKWMVLAMPILFMLACIFPPYWFTGILGQHRTINVAYLFFLMSWCLLILKWTAEINLLEKIGDAIRSYKKVVFIVFLISLSIIGNGFYALNDIFSGNASRFNNQLSARHEILKKAKENSPNEIIFTPIVHPTTLFVSDISNNPNYWINLGYNDYFELEETEIRLRKKHRD